MSNAIIPVVQPEFHFFGANAYYWKAGNDLHELLKFFDDGQCFYTIWYVPGPDTLTYEINWYRPQVEGAFVLYQVKFENRKRVTA